MEIANSNGFNGFCIIKDGAKNGGWEGRAVWYGHSGNIKLTNKTSGDNCFSKKDLL